MGCCSGYMGEVGVDLSVAPTDEAHGRGRGQGVVPDHDGMWGSVSSGPRLCVGGYIRAVHHGVGVAPGSHNGNRLTLAGTGVPPGGLHRSYRLGRVVRHFMKRLCQVTRLVEAALRLCRQSSSERAQPSPARGMGARTGPTSLASSSSVVPSPRRGEVAHPFMRALNGTLRAGAR
jgi:hypothetical protein